MSQNLAAKYSDRVDERFKLKSLTDSAVNQDYDWTGVNTVNVYSIATASMNNYVRNGTSRYGTPADLGTNVQTLTLTRDRSFTFVIDRGDWSESQMVTESGKALARQIDEVVVPEIDIYRLGVLNATAHAQKNHSADVSAVSNSNAYSVFLQVNGILDDNKVPMPNRIAFITPGFYNSIKRDSSFSKNADLAYTDLKNGQVGEVDGVVLIKVPTSYMPYHTDLIICHPSATVAPLKLEDYKTHDNPPGINGWLVEGRIIYDAFVTNSKVGAVAIHSTTPSS